MTDIPHKEKTIALRKVIYSISMLLYTSDNIVDIPDNQYQQNCLIESFLTHVRNLYSFFYKDRIKKDDIVVLDFTGKKLTRIKNDSLNNQINKSLSHLTYFEIEKKRLWNIQDIKNEFLPICLDFLENNCLDRYKLDEHIEVIKNDITISIKNKMHYG